MVYKPKQAYISQVLVLKVHVYYSVWIWIIRIIWSHIDTYLFTKNETIFTKTTPKLINCWSTKQNTLNLCCLMESGEKLASILIFHSIIAAFCFTCWAVVPSTLMLRTGCHANCMCGMNSLVFTFKNKARAPEMETHQELFPLQTWYVIS